MTQAAVGIGLLAMIAYMAAAVYLALHGIDIRDTVYLSLDCPLIVAMLIIANLFYLLYYIAVMWRQEKREPPKSDSYKEVIIVQVVAKNIPIRVVDIAYFFRLNDENFLRTNDGSDYLISDALDHIESLMDPELFFRANRQFLVRFQACERFESIERDKLELFATPPFPERIIISQKRAKGFRDWLGR